MMTKNQKVFSVCAGAATALFMLFIVLPLLPAAPHAALLSVLPAHADSVDGATDTGFGVKYKLSCEIQTPDKRNPCIITIWIVEAGMKAPKLITAYPI